MGLLKSFGSALALVNAELKRGSTAKCPSLPACVGIGFFVFCVKDSVRARELNSRLRRLNEEKLLHISEARAEQRAKIESPK